MSSPEPLTPEQEAAVVEYVAAMGHMADAMQGLTDVGLDAGTALKRIPNPEGDGSMFDALPPMARMMLA